MPEQFPRGVRSTAAIKGHPLHPMLVPFPIAFLVGALASDIAFWRLADPFWARASLYLLAAGLVMGAVAALAGLTDFLTIERARDPIGWSHLIGNGLALALALINAWIRLGAPSEPVLPGGIVLSLLTVAVLLVTGWLGGELAYRHKIGVIEPEDAPIEHAYAGGRPGVATAESAQIVPPLPVEEEKPREAGPKRPPRYVP
jgi:uncharacterized membrane protein